jgi:hypothetical protein
MPNGQVVFSSGGAYPQAVTNAVLNLLVQLIDHATTTTTGVWVQMYPFVSGSIEVTSSAGTFSVQLYGSNAENKPADATDGAVLGSAISSTGITFATYPVRWIKAKVASLSGGGNVSVMANFKAP